LTQPIAQSLARPEDVDRNPPRTGKVTARAKQLRREIVGQRANRRVRAQRPCGPRNHLQADDVLREPQAKPDEASGA